MHRRLFVLVLLSLAMTAGVSTTAAPPSVVICETDSFGQLQIVVENFERFGSAVAQCASFWNGRPMLGAGN